jgi:TrmH family RNA methyltransferase
MQPLTISSAANPKLKAAVRLRESRIRRRSSQFLVDGPREIGRALRAGRQLERLFVCQSLLSPHGSPTGTPNSPGGPANFERRIFAALHAAETHPDVEWDAATLDSRSEVDWDHLPITPDALLRAGAVLPTQLMERLAYGQRSSLMVGQFHTPRHQLSDLKLPREPLIVVLNQLEKPGNVGAILRTADAAGVDAVIVSDGSDDLYHPNVIRASCGAIFHLPIALTTSESLRNWLAQHQIRALATRVDAQSNLWETDFRGGVAILIGNEASGLPPNWNDASGLRIPMQGVTDSPNASVSAAVCLFEAVRQRRA